MSIGWRIVATLLLAACLRPAIAAVPSFDDVKTAYKPSESWLLARNGEVLQTLRVSKEGRRLAWTPLGAISPALTRAVVLAEDRRFFEHGGVDWMAAGNALWRNLTGDPTRGASTLSMQLAGLLEEDGRRRGRRSLFEKISQSAFALRLERSWSKAQILEAYLNLVGFRGEMQGVTAMSRGLFGKWPDGLDERESALAASLLRAPNAAPALVARRACALLKDMGRAGECEGLEGFATVALAGRVGEAEPTADLAPHLARRMLTQPGVKVTSSISAPLQAFAAQALRRQLGVLSRQNVEDGALLVLDNTTGEVLAWVGSSGDLSDAAEVDGVTALRQAGSTLKPFLYALAFERRNLTPATLIEDAPLTLETGNGLYAPQDYEPDYRGWVSARFALAGSLNVPAVKTLVRIGPDAFRERLRASGLQSLNQDGEWYGYSLALGSADVSLLALANAYRMLANGGRWTPLRVTPVNQPDVTPDCRQEGCAGVFDGRGRSVYSPAAAFLVDDVLSDRDARTDTFGMESWLATSYWTAAKTGTSKDMRDNWCFGFSRRYTVGVWVGNASGAPMRNVSGVSGAAPLWREVMDWLHRGDPASGRPVVPSPPPAAPPGVVNSSVHFDSRVEPPRREWFVAGTERSVIKSAAMRALARIAYPAQGTIVALDPDIPPQLQELPLRLSSPPEPGWKWLEDGRLLARASAKSPAHWLPQPGQHSISVVDASGQEMDRVRFEVRALKGR
jgi:penicillin-binding protein 1C